MTSARRFLCSLPALLSIAAASCVAQGLDPVEARAPSAIDPVGRTTGASLAAQDESATVRDFRKLFRRFELAADRIEAVYGLRGIDDPEVVDALLPVLRDKDREVVRAAIEILSELPGEASRAAVRDAFMSSRKEQERAGLLRAWALGGFEVPADDLKLVSAFGKLLKDRSWQIRLLGAQALAPARDDAAELLAPLLEDSEPAVRAGVIEALAKRRDPATVDAAIAALEDETWQVRSAAAAALGRVRDRRSIEPLLAKLEPDAGRLLSDYTNALQEITGRSFGLDLDGWRRFWKNVADRFEIPTDEEIEAERAARAESAKRYSAGTSYHGIETPSHAILFVIDVSGSMENWIMDRERFEEDKYPSWSRMDVIATELADTIRGLEPHVRFNVLAFAADVRPWRRQLAPANALQKAAAADWVLALEPIGGESAREAAAAGVGGPTDTSAGKTNTYGALMYALGVLDDKGERVGDEDYQLEVDTVFFMTDGRPTVGEFVEPGDILREVNAANELRRLVLHVTTVGQFNKSFLERLATENSGQYVDLGR